MGLTKKEIILKIFNESLFGASLKNGNYIKGIKEKHFDMVADSIVEAIKEAETSKKPALNIADVRLRSILDDRLKQHKEDFENSWLNLQNESKYQNEDGIEPFYRLQRKYKIKAQEIEDIIDIYNEV